MRRYLPLALWIVFIFFMSSGEASAEQTSRFLRPVLEFLFPGISDTTLAAAHAFVRKFAHFFEYGVLAIFASLAFFASAKFFLRQYWYLAALGLVATVAALDEFNQSFEPSRTSSPWDVALDIVGGLSALVLTYLLYLRFRKNRRDRA